MGIEVFTTRIVICFILSVLIGVERQLRHKMVGIRTNVLVALGAFMFNWMVFSCDIPDRTRVASQIVSGIGFLGAGFIIKDGSRIKGLNTAATLWCVAAIGVLTSTGMIAESCIGTLMVLLSNIILRFISQSISEKVKKEQLEICTVKITCEKESESNVRYAVVNFCEEYSININSLGKKDTTTKSVQIDDAIVTTRANVVEEMIKTIGLQIGLSSIEWKHEKVTDEYDDLPIDYDEDI